MEYITWFINNQSILFLIVIVSYSTIILIIFFTLRKLRPNLFLAAEKRQPLDAVAYEVTFIDCSLLFTVFPCGCLSVRQLIRKICPYRLISFKEFATCECIRPAIQGNLPYKVNCVCCTI